MGLIEWAEGKIRELSIWDFAVVKIALVIFGMIIGAHMHVFVKEYLMYFVGVFVALYAVLVYRMFLKK
ncbi:MAG: hypothetical protein DRN71_03950 [Candidatus Nanohalarchaeota archaeon]|nr:MAG: hypothetical protein DRN71_03950 [Candidatus Nanohaloarchaeota archaeon]